MLMATFFSLLSVPPNICEHEVVAMLNTAGVTGIHQHINILLLTHKKTQQAER